MLSESIMEQYKFERQFREATKRGEAAVRRGPRAKSAYYDRKNKRPVVELLNGAAFVVPADLVQGLRNGKPEEIAAVEIGPFGLSLHWEKLDTDCDVPALLEGLFGTRAWMSMLAAEMGRKGGSVVSPAKAAASRENGMKGGRPRKAAER